MPDSSSSSGFVNDLLLSRRGSATRHSRIYKTTYEGKLFILKAANPENGDKQVGAALLQREYQILSELDNPFIIRTWGLRNDPQIGECLILDYVDGMPLDKFLERKPTHKTRLRIINELLDAVAYLHAKQIVHKDLKPSNILITTNGGHANFDAFEQYLQQNHIESTDIPSSDTILTSSLKEGDTVILTWMPDRTCKLQYQGNNQFTVTAVENSHHLVAGCTFTAQTFILNQPLYLYNLRFPDSPAEPSTYVIASKHGLSSVDVMSPDR